MNVTTSDMTFYEELADLKASKKEETAKDGQSFFFSTWLRGEEGITWWIPIGISIEPAPHIPAPFCPATSSTLTLPNRIIMGAHWGLKRNRWFCEIGGFLRGSGPSGAA